MLIAQRRELDPEKRKRIVHDIQRYLADKAYYVYIPIGLSYHVHQPYLKGFAPKIGHTMVHRVIAGVAGQISPDEPRSTMREYLLKRVLLMVPTLFLVTILVFLLMHLRSGDVVIQMLEGYAYADTVEALRRELGLDKPLHEQYLTGWAACCRVIWDVRCGPRRASWLEFARRFPVTLELTLLTIIISVTFGVGVGILSAMRQESWLDYIGRVVAIMALAMPVLLAGHPGGGDPCHLLALDTAVDLCAADHRSPGEPQDHDLPRRSCSGVSRAGPIMRIMRSSMLEVQRQDYIRTAWAKGLPERTCHLQARHQKRLDPGGEHHWPADPLLSRRVGDHRVHLPAARHGEFLR